MNARAAATRRFHQGLPSFRTFRLASVTLACLTLPCSILGGSATAREANPAVDAPAGVPADEALATLLEGNKRFVRGESQHPHESADYRASLADAQHPFATILACSDSRVTPVLIFDQGVGDLFVIRVAGNVVDEDVAGSIEYAVDHLDTRLLLVMGHKNCGAVTAAYHAFVARDMTEREPHEIESLLMRIEPALEGLDTSLPEEMKIASGIERNVRLAIRNLKRFPDVRRSVETGRVVIRGAIYDLETGQVELLPE